MIIHSTIPPIKILPSQVFNASVSIYLYNYGSEHTTRAYDEEIGLVAPTGLDINPNNSSSSSSRKVRRATGTSTSTPSDTSSAAAANVDRPSWKLTVEQTVVLIIGLLLLPILTFALYKFRQRLVRAWKLRKHHPGCKVTTGSHVHVHAHASLSLGIVDAEKGGDPLK